MEWISLLITDRYLFPKKPIEQDLLCRGIQTSFCAPTGVCYLLRAYVDEFDLIRQSRELI